jgi:hypothetical protein
MDERRTFKAVKNIYCPICVSKLSITNEDLIGDHQLKIKCECGKSWLFERNDVIENIRGFEISK